MEFILSQNEIAYIQSEFNYKNLYGVSSYLCNKRKAEGSLVERKLMYPVRDCFELCNELRFLLATWNQVKFAMTRPDIHDRNHDIFLVSDEKCIMYFKREKEQYTIRYVDMDSSIMDFYMASCMQLLKLDNVANSFNVKISMNMLDMIIKDGSETALKSVSKETGLPVEWLSEYRRVILTPDYPAEACSLVLTEDLKENVGCLTKIIGTNEAIYAFKHITRGSDEQAVIIKGGTDFVVNCMYNF